MYKTAITELTYTFTKLSSFNLHRGISENVNNFNVIPEIIIIVTVVIIIII